MPSALAIKLVSAYKESTERSREQQQKFLEERRMLKTIGPQRWEELRANFRKTVDDCNVEAGFQLLQWCDLASNLLKVAKSGGVACVTGTFDPEANSLTISGPRDFDSMVYEQKVLGDDVLFVTTRQSENRPESADDIVARFLGKLTLV
jgi:hypothetical protein